MVIINRDNNCTTEFCTHYMPIFHTEKNFDLAPLTFVVISSDSKIHKVNQAIIDERCKTELTIFFSQSHNLTSFNSINCMLFIALRDPCARLI